MTLTALRTRSSIVLRHDLGMPTYIVAKVSFLGARSILTYTRTNSSLGEGSTMVRQQDPSMLPYHLTGTFDVLRILVRSLRLVIHVAIAVVVWGSIQEVGTV